MALNGGVTAPRGRGRKGGQNGAPRLGGAARAGAGNGGMGRNQGVDPGYAPPNGKPPIKSGMAPAPGGGGGGRGKGGRGKIGVGGGGMAGPGGRQLSARVASGKITQEQADRTMKQRQTLAKAFGPEWRKKLSSGGKSFAQVNAGLAKNPKDPKLAALRKKLVAGRASALEAARAKGKGKGKAKGKGGGVGGNEETED